MSVLRRRLWCFGLGPSLLLSSSPSLLIFVSFSSFPLSNIDFAAEPSSIFHCGLEFTFALAASPQAHLLDAEFKNYHYILESTKSAHIVGVPLCCQIIYLNILILVKAPLPSSKKSVSNPR